MPGNWLVYDAVPWAPGQVLLWAAKTLPVPHVFAGPHIALAVAVLRSAG